MRRIATGLVAILTACSFSTVAFGDCDELLQEKRQYDDASAALVQDYPGTVAALGVCILSVKDRPRNEQFGAFVTNCGIACLFVGMDACWHVGSEIIRIQEGIARLRRDAPPGCYIPE